MTDFKRKVKGRDKGGAQGEQRDDSLQYLLFYFDEDLTIGVMRVNASVLRLL